jgi:hypothetical protein
MERVAARNHHYVPEDRCLFVIPVEIARACCASISLDTGASYVSIFKSHDRQLPLIARSSRHSADDNQPKGVD